MKKMYFILSSLLFALILVSCNEDQQVANKTLEAMVKNAEIFSEEFPFSESSVSPSANIPSGSFLYIPTPTGDGYLKFEIKSTSEKNEILNLVQKRFEKEFDQVKNKPNSSAKKGCTEWLMLEPGDPNSGLFRVCMAYMNPPGSYMPYAETCACGYCCDMR